MSFTFEERKNYIIDLGKFERAQFMRYTYSYDGKTQFFEYYKAYKYKFANFPEFEDNIPITALPDGLDPYKDHLQFYDARPQSTEGTAIPSGHEIPAPTSTIVTSSPGQFVKYIETSMGVNQSYSRILPQYEGTYPYRGVTIGFSDPDPKIKIYTFENGYMNGIRLILPAVMTGDQSSKISEFKGVVPKKLYKFDKDKDILKGGRKGKTIRKRKRKRSKKGKRGKTRKTSRL